MSDISHRTAEDRDPSEYLGMDRDELRAVILQRDAEIERLRREAARIEARAERDNRAVERAFGAIEDAGYRDGLYDGIRQGRYGDE